jgi:hypothetical protein
LTEEFQGVFRVDVFHFALFIKIDAGVLSGPQHLPIYAENVLVSLRYTGWTLPVKTANDLSGFWVLDH